ncbi:hypothetical protein ANANG_G00107460 [Anguilla anguilla]|uniref:Uncharacterized protein n=1 Tax=Anguilla anguilla TaxID=7936 RepID=A0A9D3MJQ2_ANGAN|nr:hypothetical protein ANANG_G00107460 [Anguilla anguilla]
MYVRVAGYQQLYILFCLGVLSQFKMIPTCGRSITIQHDGSLPAHSFYLGPRMTLTSRENAAMEKRKHLLKNRRRNLHTRVPLVP